MRALRSNRASTSRAGRPTRRAAGAALAAALVVTGASGCGKAAEKVAERAAEESVERASDGQADVDLAEGSFEVETEDGTFSAGTGELPASWPDDIPLPDDMAISAASESDRNGGEITLIGSTDLALDDTVALIEDGLADWETTDRTTASAGGGESININLTQGTRTLFVQVNDNGTGSTSLNFVYSAGGA